MTCGFAASDVRPRSSYHLRARELLARLYPLDRRLEEVHLPGSDGLYVDFFLPGRRLMVEVHGEQHYNRTSIFHETMLDFWKGQARDRKKEDWAILNHLRLVELPCHESVELWTERLRPVS